MFCMMIGAKMLVFGGISTLRAGTRYLMGAVGSFFILSSALAAGSNLNFTYQGRAFQSDGATPLTSSNVSFKLGIYSHNGNCLLYEEEHTGVNLNSTNGLFSLQVGGGTSTANTPAGQTMLKVFTNGSAIDVASNSQGACGAATYTPTTNQIRKLKVTIVDGATTIVLAPMQEIVSTPYAMVAETLQGKDASKFVQVTGSVTQNDLESIMAQKATLLDLAAGTSNLYLKAGSALTSSLNLGNQRITNVGTPTGSTDAVNKSYADARVGGMSVDATVAALSSAGGDNGKVLAWDSTNQKWTAQAFIPTITAGSITNTMLASGIDASKITTGTLPAAQIPSLDAATITTGTFAAAQIPSLDGAKIGTGTVAYARLPVGTAASTVAAGDDSRITGALQKSGGTMSGDINMGSNKITAVANVPFAAAAPSAAQDGQTLVWNNGSSSWTWVTPGVAGSGLTNFNGATGSTQSFATPGTSGAAPNWSTASNAHTLNIPMASAASVTAGLLSNADYTSFGNKFSASSGGTITGNVTFSGTVSMPAFSMGGALNMASHAINGVTDPTLAQDAATKNYADTHIGGGAFSTALTGNSGKLLTVNGTEDGFILTTAPIGTITGVTAGAGLTGGGINGTVSLAIDTGTTNGKIVAVGGGDKIATSLIDTGTGANQIVRLDASSKLPVIDGSALTNITASNMKTGTVVAIANGGTGTTTTSSAAQFFAGPTGAGGAPSFRTIASTDLPTGTVSGSGTTGYLPYYSAGSTLADSPIYSSGGNVGIGTTVPAYSLDVVGAINSSAQIYSRGGTFEAIRAASQELRLNGGSGNQWRVFSGINGTTNGDLLFQNTTDNFSSVFTTPLVLTNGGNIGIGTLNPARKFVVYDSTGTNNGDNVLRPLQRLHFSHADSNRILDFGILGNYQAGYIQGGDLAGNFYSISLQPSGGNVGIGTTSPVAKLDVSGSVRLGDDGIGCSSSIRGTIRNNANTGITEVCNGTSWASVDGSVSVPAGVSIAIYGSCPAGWTGGDVLKLVGNNTGAVACQSPSDALLPASTSIVMESCPTGWASLGIWKVGSNPVKEGGLLSFNICQSPASATGLKPGSRVVMNIGTCPANWVDTGLSVKVGGANITCPTCAPTAEKVCEIPGRAAQSAIIGNSGGTTGDGSSVVISGGVAGTTSGTGGSASLIGGGATDGNGGHVIITAGSGATSTSTARNGGAISLTSGSSASGGTAGTISLQTGSDGSGNYSSISLQSGGGSVGIGVTNPGQKLQVGASGDGSVAIANAWNTFSDIRLKKGLEKIPNACEMVDQMSGYYYYWKDGEDHSRQVGVIAQEVEKVLPELVKAGSDGIKTVDYPKLTAVLIEALKQHNRDIASIKTENADLKARLEKIEKMLDSK